jgi:hypothetical protein
MANVCETTRYIDKPPVLAVVRTLSESPANVRAFTHNRAYARYFTGPDTIGYTD